MQQLYTSDLQITEVDYEVDGRLANLQGTATGVRLYAEVTLMAVTAKQFNWANLTTDQDWGV